jgi:hypothetical protein
MKSIEVKGFRYDVQPYGLKVIDGVWKPIVANEDSSECVKYCASKGLGIIEGIVIEGGTLNRLFHHTSFVSEVGNSIQVWAVSIQDLERNHMIRVCM